MTIARSLAAASLAFTLLAGTAFAQTAAPAVPAATTAAPAMATDKKAKAKECSLEADKQGLHGKARKAFRSKCKSGRM